MPFITAALGGEAKVQTLNGQVMCRIPEGTQSGSKIRLKGKGIQAMGKAGVYGDLYVTVQVQVPRNFKRGIQSGDFVNLIPVPEWLVQEEAELRKIACY